MAKFFLTNDKSIYDNLKKVIVKSPFKISFENISDGVFAIATHKLKVDNQNYAKSQNDFCIAVGTCIYKESMDYGLLLNDLNKNVYILRDKTIGQYAVCCKKNDKCYIYADSFSCFDIFYYRDTKKWLVSNSLYDIACVLHDELTLNENAVATYAINPYGLLNGTTYFHEIKRLQRDEYITISIPNKEFIVDNIVMPFPIADNTEFDKMVEYTANALRNNARVSAKIFGTPTICTTGGLDSRLIIASYISAGIKPLLLSGKRVMAGRQVEKEDNKVAHSLARKYGLKVVDVDFSWADPVDRDWDELIPVYGIPTAYMYAGQKTILNSLTNETTDVVTFGWGGEPYREDMRCKIDLKDEEKANLVDLLFDYYQASFVGMRYLCEQIPNYKENNIIEMQEQAKHFGIKTTQIGADDLWKLTIAGEAQGDTQVISCLQQVKYCYLPLFEYNALRNRVRPSMRKNAKFMLAVMQKLCPSILEVPFYTRQAWNKVDTNDLTIHIIPNKVDVLYDKMSWLRDIASERIKKNFLRPIKRMVYSLFRQTKAYPVQNISEERIDGSFTFRIIHSEDPVSFYRYELLKKILCQYLKF